MVIIFWNFLMFDQVFPDIYSYIYTLSMFSSNLFFFKDLFSTEPWLHSNFFLPMKIESILINSVCLELSFTVTSSKNNFWVSITNSEVLRIKDRTLSCQWLHKNTNLINTPLLRKFCKQTHDSYYISNHCPHFRLANTLDLSGSLHYLVYSPGKNISNKKHLAIVA